VKLQCELCREIVAIDRFESDAQGLTIACPACSESYFIAAKSGSVGERKAVAAKVRRVEPSDSEQGRRCPKCDGLVADTALACRGCGLLAKNFESYEHDADAAVPDELLTLWATCRETWTDDDAHERFADQVVSYKSFAFAAKVYRQELRARPDDERAADRLDRVSRMAEAAYLTKQPRKMDKKKAAEPYKGVVMLLIAIVLLAGIGAMFLMMRSSQEPEPPVLYDSTEAPAGTKVPPAARR
jgi:hypothetical protein